MWGIFKHGGKLQNNEPLIQEKQKMNSYTMRISKPFSLLKAKTIQQTAILKEKIQLGMKGKKKVIQMGFSEKEINVIRV